MGIHKAIIEVVVLFDSEHISPEFFVNASLASIEAAMDDKYLGQVNVKTIAPIPAEKVHEELRALGYDGEFLDPVTNDS